MHHMKRHKLVDEWKTATFWSFMSATGRAVGQKPSFVTVTIPFSTKRRRDPHNYCGTVVKSIIDGMVTAGAWKDDTPEYVRHIEPVLIVDKSGLVTVLLEAM